MRLCLLMRLDPSQRRTHGQGVDQSTGPLQGVTQGGERERRRRSLREIGKESLIIIVTVSHTLATQRHHQSALALGVWRVTLCLSSHPSIHPSLPVSSYTHIHKHVFFSLSRSQSPTLFVSAKGIFCHALFITALHHCHSCQSSHTGSGPRLWDVLFLRSSPAHILPLGQGHVPVASVKSSEKTLT